MGGRPSVRQCRIQKKKGLAVAYLLTPVYLGAGERSRTLDLRITNALLYQLSYTGKGRNYSPLARDC